MAKLKSLPSLEIIKGFKGVIDYAVYRGVPSARKWPRTPRSHLTAATLATAAIFGQVISAFRLLAPDLLALLKIEAADQPRSERDIYVQATYGYLHEAPDAMILQQDDLQIAIASTINFEGDLVQVTDEGEAKVTVDISSGPPPTIEIQEDDLHIADATIINFEGGGGKVTDEGAGKVTVDITPGAGVGGGVFGCHGSSYPIYNQTINLGNTYTSDDLRDGVIVPNDALGLWLMLRGLTTTAGAGLAIDSADDTPDLYSSRNISQVPNQHYFNLIMVRLGTGANAGKIKITSLTGNWTQVSAWPVGYWK